MFKNKRAIIFDMDGTLIDSVGIWNEIDRRILNRFGNNNAKALSEQEIQEQRDSLLRKFKREVDPYKEYYKELKGLYDFEVSADIAIKERYNIAQEMLKDLIDYKPGADVFLKALKDRGFTLAIASTTKKSNMEVYKTKNKNIINKANIDDMFSIVYTREDAVEMKPDPEIYIKAMATLGMEPEECLIFEDSLIGAEAAKASKAEVVVIYDKYSDDERVEINKLADYVVDDYNTALEILNRCFD